MKRLSTLFIIILFLSCSTNTDSIPTENRNENKIFSLSDYFPLKIGNDWLHVIVTNSQDTLYFERDIVDTLRNEEGLIVYKTKSGAKDFPPNVNF